jgi:hypothetical protein
MSQFYDQVLQLMDHVALHMMVKTNYLALFLDKNNTLSSKESRRLKSLRGIPSSKKLRDYWNLLKSKEKKSTRMYSIALGMISP